MKQSTTILILLLCLSFKCSKKEEFVSENAPKIFSKVNPSNLQFHGIYKFTLSENNIANDMRNNLDYTRFVYFFGNGFCANCILFSHTDSTAASALIHKTNNIEIKEGGGVFSINSGGIIKAIYRIDYTSRGIPHLNFAIFSGLLKNKDSIVNFRLLKPYPKNFTSSDTIPRTLVFQKFPAKLTLDSNNYYIKKFIK